MTSELKEIKQLIKDNEVVQTELADKVGVNHIHLNSVLRERNPLSNRLYKRLKYHLTENVKNED